MKQELNTLRQREVPASLDAAVLSAARLSAFRRNKRQRAKRLLFAASGMAAAIAACFAAFVTLPYQETRNEAQYYALNDLSIIERGRGCNTGQTFFDIVQNLCPNIGG